MSKLEPIGEPHHVRVEPSALPRGYAVVDPSLAGRLRSEHSRVFEVEAVVTRAGPEQLTRDVPNVAESELAPLGGDGVALVGTSVTPGTMLVGKITPRGGSAPSPEEKLLRAIFGEAAGEVRDTSLRAPPGCFGVVARSGLEPGGEGGGSRAWVEIEWERPLDVGDVLLVDDEEVVVAAIEPIGAALAWSGGAHTASVAKAAMARDRIHARSIGPYSIVTQQPLEGRENFGGQRVTTPQLRCLAEHAPWVAWEMFTVKADDVTGRARTYEALVRQQNPDVAPHGAPAAPAGAAAPGGGGKPDIFSFFEPAAASSGEVARAEPEAVKTVVAHLRAMALELQLGATKVGAMLRSAEDVREASHGEVRKPETINYRTLQPEPGGLFCQRIFGPVQDYACACGKYQRMKHRGVVCEKCGVEVIASRVRRERFAHVALASPCLHPLLVEAVGLLLGLEEDEVRAVAAGRRVLREGDGGLYTEPREEESVGGSRALWEALESLDLPAIGAMEAGPRADLAEVLDDAELPATALMLTVLPVLPPDLRPLVPLDGGFATSHLNDLYRRVINFNNRLARLVQLDAPAIIVVNESNQLQEAVDALMINGWLDEPRRGPDQEALRALAIVADDIFADRIFAKPVDYSGVAHLVVDPTLSPGQCRVPRSMLTELFRPWAYGVLEARGYVTTIKSAKRTIEGARPEGLAAVEEASEGFPVLLMTGSCVVSRVVRAWDAPAIAVDADTAAALGDRVVTLHVPLTHEAGLQTTTLPDLPTARFHGVEGWLVEASREGELTRPAFEAMVAGATDELDDPLVALALGRPPAPLEAQQVEDWAGWDRDRRERVRAAITEREGAEPATQEPAPHPHLDRSIDELEVSVRTATVFTNLGLRTLRDLCRRTEAELLKTKNFGRRNLQEVKEILADLGLGLGMRDV